MTAPDGRPAPAAFLVFHAWWRDQAAGHLDAETDLEARYGVVLEGAATEGLGFDLVTGSEFGGYVIEKLAGVGGQARVYRARDPQLDRLVALKVLQPYGVLSETLQARFAREGRLIARLDHPGICPILESGVCQGRPYLAMPWIEGDPLDAYVASLPEPRASAAGQQRILALGIRLGEALDAAHQHQVLHRDLKPSNVLVRSNGEPILLDFGIGGEVSGALTALTATGDFFGTLGYMAPEQCGIVPRWSQVDPRADQFSLAVVLWELFAGSRPFPAGSRLEYESALRSGKVPELPGSLRGSSIERVLRRALRFDPRERLDDVAALVRELRACARGQSTLSSAPGWGARTANWARREPLLAALTAALLLTLGLGLAASLHELQRANAATALARRQAYRSGLAAAQARAQAGDPVSALAELERCPAELRAWEWWRLRLQVDPSTERTATGKGARPWVRCASVAVDVQAGPQGGSRVLARGEDPGSWRILSADGRETRGRGAGRPPWALAAGSGRIWSICDGELRCIDAEGRTVHRLTLGLGTVRRLCASPCGRFVAVYSGDRQRSTEIRRVADGASLARVLHGSHHVSGFAFGTSGSRLLIATVAPSRSRRTRLRWHGVFGGRVLAEREVPFRQRGPICVDPRDEGLVVAAADGSVRWLDAGLTHERQRTLAHVDGCAAILVDPAQDTMHAVAADGASCHWRGRAPHDLRTARLNGRVLTAAFRADGASLAACDAAGGHWLFTRTNQRLLPAPWQRSVFCLPSADGLQVTSGRALAQWDPDAGRFGSPTVVPSGWIVTGLRSDGAGAYVGRTNPAGGGEIGFWSAAGGITRPRQVQRFDHRVAALPDRRRFAYFDGDKLHCVDDEGEVERVVDLGPIGRAESIAIDPGGTAVVVGTQTGQLAVVSFATGAMQVHRVDRRPVRRVAVFPDADRILAVVGEAEPVVYSRSFGEVLLRLRPVLAPVRALAIDATGHLVALGLADGSLVVYGDGRVAPPIPDSVPEAGFAASAGPADARRRATLADVLAVPDLPREVYEWIGPRATEASLRQRATLSLRLGDPAAAVALYRQAAAALPEGQLQPKIQLGLTMALAQAGRDEEARRTLVALRTWCRRHGVVGKGADWDEVELRLAGARRDRSLDGEAALRLQHLCRDPDLTEDLANQLVTWCRERGVDRRWPFLLALLEVRRADWPAAAAALAADRPGLALMHRSALWCALAARVAQAEGRGEAARTCAERVHLLAASDLGESDQEEARGLVVELRGLGL